MANYKTDDVPAIARRGVIPHTIRYDEPRDLHPDGQPWEKCCRNDPNLKCNCAFIDRRLTVRTREYAYDDGRYYPLLDTPFVCVHRQDDGYFRVCAGWHAIFGKQYAEKHND